MARSAASEAARRASGRKTSRAVGLGAGVVVAAVVLVVLASRPGRRVSSSPLASDAPGAGGGGGASVVAAESGAGAALRETVVDPEAARLRALVAEMTELMRRAEGLSADDGAEFQELATLTNEFDNGLTAEKAAALVREMPAGFLATPWGDLALRHWARADREAAAAWMAAHPDPSPVAATALMHDWFAQDGAGAFAYAAALPAGVWRSHVAMSASEEALVAEAPADAMRFLALSAADHPRRQELQEWVALHWGRLAPEEAAAWAERAETPELRDRLLASAAIGRANRDPEAAARWLQATASAGEAQTRAAEAIARLWTARDPEAAGRWVESLPAGALRESAEAGLLAVASPRGEGPAVGQ